MEVLRYACIFLLLGRTTALEGMREVLESDAPPRQQAPLNTPAIDALPAYDTVRVATIHYDFNGASISDVPQVQLELGLLGAIFQDDYHFDVRDISIPRTADAQTSLTSDITNLFSGLSGPGSLVIIVYGGHGGEGGTWIVSVISPQPSLIWMRKLTFF